MKGRNFVIILAGFLPFLFVCDAYSKKTPKCAYFIITEGSQDYLTHSQVPVIVHNDLIIDLDKGTVLSSGSYNALRVRVAIFNVTIVKYIDNAWNLLLYKSFYVEKGWKPNLYNNLDDGISYSVFQIFAARYHEGCLNQSCVNIDSDGDGVCDQCDKKPGEQDPNDCIVFSTQNASGATTSWTVSPGCTENPDEYEFYKSSSHSPDDYIDMPQTATPLAPKNCNKDADGSCGCLYAPASDGPGSLTPNPGDTGGGSGGGSGGDTGGGSGSGSGDGSGEGDGDGKGDMQFSGNADYPVGVEYDKEVDNSTLEEKSLAKSITQYMQDGLPVVSHFKDTRLRVVGSNPILRANIFSREVIIDFSTIDDFLRMAGVVLVFICTVIAFMIIVRRG